MGYRGSHIAASFKEKGPNSPVSLRAGVAPLTTPVLKLAHDLLCSTNDSSQEYWEHRCLILCLNVCVCFSSSDLFLYSLFSFNRSVFPVPFCFCLSSVPLSLSLSLYLSLSVPLSVSHFLVLLYIVCVSNNCVPHSVCPAVQCCRRSLRRCRLASGGVSEVVSEESSPVSGNSDRKLKTKLQYDCQFVAHLRLGPA